MKKQILSVLVALSVAVFGTVASADPGQGRENRQEARIEEGRADGSLTRAEARQLEVLQRQIDRAQKRAMKDGVVTPREAAQLKRLQDRASRIIARARHNAHLG